MGVHITLEGSDDKVDLKSILIFLTCFLSLSFFIVAEILKTQMFPILLESVVLNQCPRLLHPLKSHC